MAADKCIYLWIISFLFGALCLALDDQRGAFVQTGEELHFYVDTNQYWSESLSSQLLADNRPPITNRRSSPPAAVDRTARRPSSSENNSHQSVDEKVDGIADALNQLKFEPESLQFGFQAVGVPEVKKVKVTNPTASKVRFDAISGSTVHFHCSFFDDKTIEPGSSTTFDVVFLPRQEGEFRNHLSIHSSLGAFQYFVSGIGTSNPYRLRPFVGARVPLNGTFIGTLEMHNPHSTTLRVVEMYTSGGGLHVELPVKGRGDGVPAGSVWEIPPYQTRTVAKARYIGGRVKNVTAYIRIKTDRDYDDDGQRTNAERRQEALIVPVEIEVTAKAGLYAAVDRLDFGTIVEGEQSRWAILEIYNTHNHTVEIVSVERDSQSLHVDFQPVVSLASGTRSPSYVAKFAYEARRGEADGKRLRSGRIVLKSKHGRYALTVPYSVQVLEGRLIHEPGQLAFYSSQHQLHSVERNITLWNVFDTPVAIFNVSLPKSMRKLFKVENFSSAVVIPARSSKQVMTLSYVADGDLNVVQAESRLRLLTNISRFDIPLFLFDGALRFTLYSIYQKEFDFGVMDAGNERFILFAVTNENPIPITIKNMTSGLPAYATLELLGVEEGNHSVLSYDHNQSEYKWQFGEDFTVPARSFAVFSFAVTAPVQRATYHTRVIFKTAFQLIEFPLTFSVEEGDVVSVPEKVVIGEAFPGKISSHVLQVYSTFAREMPLIRLSTLSNDPRFFFESFDQEQSPIIEPGKLSRIGRLFFMPVAACLDDCYVGLPLQSEEGHLWIRGMRLPANLPEIDMYLYRKLRSKWDAIVDRGEHVANSTIMVDTTQVKNFAVKAEGRLVWPRLMKQSSIHFPLTAVGNYTVVNVTLQNPSNLPVAVQLLPLTIYPGPYDLVKMLDNDLDAPLTSYVEVDDVLIFSLRDSELYNAKPESPVPQLRQELERAVGIQIPRFTLSMLLQPGMKVRVRIGFLPPDYQLRSTLLLIRNNLTVLETTTLYGRGGKLELRIGSKLPNTKQPLLVEVPDKFLKECENVKRLQHKLLTHLTVRRSFVARNTGELPLLISNLSVSGQPCFGRGFRVLNCEPFRIQPNGTHVLDIAFTPDFTVSWYEATLQLYIAGAVAPLYYSIGASVPKEWLVKCQAALPRPYWEPLMYYSCVVALGFLLICVIASAYLEGDRIITCAYKQQLCSYRRRMYELDEDVRPFSFRQNGSENMHLDADAHNGPVGDGYENVFDGPDLDASSSGERPRSLPYRLMMLFYYLITKRFLSKSGEKSGPSSSSSKVTTAQVVVGGRVVRSAVSVSSHKAQDQAVSEADGKSRRNTFGHASTIAKLHNEGDRCSSPGTASKRSVNRHSQHPARTQANKNAKKRSTHSISSLNHETQTADTNSRKAEKENVIVNEEGKPGKFEPPLEAISTQSDQKSRNTSSEANSSRRHLSFYENENRRSDSENAGRKEEVGRTPLRSRSSREVSESEPDDRTGKAKSNQQKGRKISFGKSTYHARVDEGQSMASVVTAPYAFKPDNRATAAALKNKPQKRDAVEPGRLLTPPPTNSGGRSEGEESAPPEWDRASPGGNINTDEAFDKLATETSSFAATVKSMDGDSGQKTLPSKGAASGRNVTGQHLTVSTGSGPETNGSSPVLLSPMGNESVISSTSLSDSISSLDASESSSPSPVERKAKAPVERTEPATVDTSQRKKKLTPPLRHDHRFNKSAVEKIQPIGKQAPMLDASQRGKMDQPKMILEKEGKAIIRGGAVGDGRRAAALAKYQQAQQPVASSQSKSIMQQLREDRMRRLHEHYLRKAQAGEEWPGFDRPSLAESLWDEEHDPWRGTAPSVPERGQLDMWGQPSWIENASPPDRRRGTGSPFPSLFDFPVVSQNVSWSNSLEVSDHRDGSSLNLLGLCHAQHQVQASNSASGSGMNITPPPPVDSSILAWGPPVSVTGTTEEPWPKAQFPSNEVEREQTTGRGNSSMQSAAWSSSVMTGVDLMWPQNAMQGEQLDDPSRGGNM